MKTRIFNLIILDESGSMGHLTQQTVSGCNEVINTIRCAQKQYEDEQEHFISIYAFQDGGDVKSRYIVKNAEINGVGDLAGEDYRPCGCTPLYDAVGSTLVDLRSLTSELPGSLGSVTIITDGYENASKHYTAQKVAQMISQLKEKGWNFNFIGANIDVATTASALNIDNHLEFQSSEEGTQQMYAKQSASRMNYFTRLKNTINAAMSEEERCCAMCEASKDFFKDEEEDGKGKD